LQRGLVLAGDGGEQWGQGNLGEDSRQVGGLLEGLVAARLGGGDSQRDAEMLLGVAVVGLASNLFVH